MEEMPVHVAITRRVKPGCEAEFQKELREFFQASFDHGGVLGASMITPPPGSDSREFGILRTFASEAERDAFYAWPVFKAWEQRAQMLTEGEAEYRHLTGLEAWFRSPTPPPRWKMAAVTLLGVYPVSLFFGSVLAPRLGSLPSWLDSLIISALIVASLTWFVMPLLTRVLSVWLNPRQ